MSKSTPNFDALVSFLSLGPDSFAYFRGIEGLTLLSQNLFIDINMPLLFPQQRWVAQASQNTPKKKLFY